MVERIFGCRTLLDVRGTAAGPHPAAWGRRRSRASVPADPGAERGDPGPALPSRAGPLPPGRRAAAADRAGAGGLRDRLRRIPIAGVTVPDEAFLAMREDGLTTAYDLLAATSRRSRTATGSTPASARRWPRACDGRST